MSNQVTTPRVLISGASFAGLASAFWMHELGYHVTVVETGSGVKRGGTPVDIRDETVEIIRRMGLLEAIQAVSLPPRTTEFANLQGGIDLRIEADAPNAAEGDNLADGYEIHRDDLLAILLDALADDVDFRYDNSITALTDLSDGIRATFRDGTEDDFALVLGCDGNHSVVRRLRFGPEAQFTHFLQNYFTVAIVDETFIEPGVTRILNTPGRTSMLNSYAETTDIVLAFHADDEIAYDYHDVDEQKQIVRERFADAGSTFTDLVTRAEQADNFYFDKLSQIRMPGWASGRVALVGDAGYCASPAAGMGGSLAIIGATALHDAFVTAGGDVEAAFAEYERTLRPVVERIQTQAETFGVPMFFPDTAEAIEARNAALSGQ